MKWMKFILIIIIFVLIGLYNKEIVSFFKKAIGSTPKLIISEPNEYYKEVDYNYVKISKDFIPYSMQDVKDIFYSILNRGYNTFTFYCPSEYTNCLNDIETISNDHDILTNINNFVSPFNSFSNVKIIYSTDGEVNVEISKLYNDDEINSIKTKMDEIKKQLFNDTMKDADKVLAIHDYIINNTRYDVERQNGDLKYNSNKANGALMEGYAVCGGYADAFALFLDDLNIPNMKISSKTHVWNAIYLDNKWLNVDLTWDDPVTVNSDIQTLSHKFYLINTKKLEDYKIEDHNFDKTIYAELNNN